MSSRIERLPAELVDNICSFSSLHDVCSLRQTCSTLAHKTYPYFGDEIFHDFHLMLTSEGLQTLEYVASHDVFRHSVKTLWVLPAVFCGGYTWTSDQLRVLTAGGGMMTGQLHQPPATSQSLDVASSLSPQSRHALYNAVVMDHIHTFLPWSQDGSDSITPLQLTLEKCLPLLTNLQNVGLSDTDGSPNTPWGPWNGSLRGAQTLETQLGFDPISPRFPRQAFVFSQTVVGPFRAKLFQSIILSTLLSAIGSSQTPIKTLRIESPIVVEQGLFLTPAEEASVKPILRELKDLVVSLSTTISTQADWENICLSKEDVDYFLKESTLWARKSLRPGKGRCDLVPLLSHTSSTLRKLQLNFSSEAKIIFDLAVRQGAWAANFKSISELFAFSHLSSLRLANAYTTASSFKRMMATTSETLKELFLENITWKREHALPTPQTDDYQVESLQVAGEICECLRHHSGLEAVVLAGWSFENHPITIIYPTDIGHVIWNDEGFQAWSYKSSRDGMSFRQWIEMLRFYA
ncbi:hypothetical protein N7541_010930 [Penicillium brevicompactum]|uniref:F-box domain-containing protein n=1 Tax=Penicillium brevicompactum TaxID=5074 RepID=A0A9W9QPA9_PENBR|nr:hypothetical protein N7541_010930 [Penicillium brevicompactum]